MSAMYQTRQRTLIWEYLCAHPGEHIAAETIAEALRADGVGKSTIYRYLDRLSAEGRIRRFFIEEGAGACYQLVEEAGECREHFHLKCLRCGKLLHLECDILKDAEHHILRRHQFEVDNTKTVLYGICGTCADSEQGEPIGENEIEKKD